MEEHRSHIRTTNIEIPYKNDQVQTYPGTSDQCYYNIKTSTLGYNGRKQFLEDYSKPSVGNVEKRATLRWEYVYSKC